MLESRDDLEARARWCRRLARDCGDAEIGATLKRLAADLDRRAAGVDGLYAAPARAPDKVDSIQ